MTWMYPSLLFTIKGHLGWFWFQAIMNNLLWKFAYGLLGKHNFLFLWDKCPRLPSLSYMVFCMFSLVWNCQTVFQSGCTILHFHQQYVSDPASSCSCQHLVLSLFPILAVLIGMWYFIAVLIHVSLMPGEVGYIFICISSLVFMDLPFSNWIFSMLILRVLYIF